MPVLTVKRPLREKLGDEATDALVDLINQAQAEQTNGILKFVEEKFERRLSEEISKLETKISETRADLIKWMFIFWVGQVAVILGILFTFFKK
ncbi:MAG: hypothetical protein ONB44_16195 [candidate division KSB1 bacterium]|nr:hypothetical protein [candidate division KSB1 bacterium]MDZ7303674.1 hypothetical protein [candidate division KSB1 bacterium]MDZ7313305.1 hypothetical protein [candidate division KSB1 bacterium]